MNRCGVIYAIYCSKTNRVYVGRTVNYKKRIQKHKRELKQNKHYNVYLQKDYNLYGDTAFKYIILESNVVENSLDIRETYYIDLYGGIESDLVYNMQNLYHKNMEYGISISQSKVRYYSLE